jgi:hypothetical protein
VNKQCFKEAEGLCVGSSDYKSGVFKLETHQSTFLQVVTRGGYENIRKNINQQAVEETKHILTAKNTWRKRKCMRTVLQAGNTWWIRKWK